MVGDYYLYFNSNRLDHLDQPAQTITGRLRHVNGRMLNRLDALIPDLPATILPYQHIPQSLAGDMLRLLGRVSLGAVLLLISWYFHHAEVQRNGGVTPANWMNDLHTFLAPAVGLLMQLFQPLRKVFSHVGRGQPKQQDAGTITIDPSKIHKHDK